MPRKKSNKKSVLKKKNQTKLGKKRKTLKAKAGLKNKTKKVTAVPKNYNSITPYLIVENAADAIQFYKTVFGAKEMMRMESPDNKVAHAELKIGDAKIMLADEFPERAIFAPTRYTGSAIHIHLYIKNVDAVVEKAVEQGAAIIRPIENMFYGDRSGTIKDPFGHQWDVSTHIEDVTPAKLKKRAAEFHKNSRE